jgi:outer membrane translocation and assembly module TamA
VSGGISLSSLESLHHAPASEMASVVTAAVDYRHEWQGARRVRQRLESGYGVRISADGLGSDFSYRRHFAHARYRFDNGDHAILANAFVGSIIGDAPLFERFTLGDSTTLRGWNKFELAPAGGNRVFHQSIEYRFHGAALFFDSGSLWDDGRTREFRAATGFGWHSDNFFATVAFPLDDPGTDATFMIGVRF